jgi:hypothetical protein
MMFVVSAKSQEALLQYLNNYLDFCLDADDSLFHSSATDTDLLVSRPTFKTSLLELKRESESNCPYRLATLVAS